MSYTVKDYPTKESLREALAKGETVRVTEPGLGTVPENGTVYIEGPHYPKPHTWDAKGEMRDGVLIKVN